MKKFLIILVAVIGFGIPVNAQDYSPKCGVNWICKKDGLPYDYENNSFLATTFCYVFENTTSKDVTIRVRIKAVHSDGSTKAFSDTFTIKSYSTQTTTVGKFAIFKTGWTSPPIEEEVYVTCL